MGTRALACLLRSLTPTGTIASGRLGRCRTASAPGLACRRGWGFHRLRGLFTPRRATLGRRFLGRRRSPRYRRSRRFLLRLLRLFRLRFTGALGHWLGDQSLLRRWGTACCGRPGRSGAAGGLRRGRAPFNLLRSDGFRLLGTLPIHSRLASPPSRGGDSGQKAFLQP